MKKQQLIHSIEEILQQGGIDSGYDDLNVEIAQDRELVFSVDITRMYSYVKLQFKTLDAISKLFQTDQINLENGHQYSGCETCDYGSSYEVILEVKGSPLVLEE